MIDLTIKIAGAAGQGMQTISTILARSLTRQGYYIYCYQDLMSRIRGGHNFATIRISDQPVGGLAEKSNILIALNAESVELHSGEMITNGVIVYDDKLQPFDKAQGKNEDLKIQNNELNLFPVPMEKLAVEAGQNKILVNSVACGVCFNLMEYDFDVLADTLGDIFNAKGDAMVEANIRAARAGFEYARKNFPEGTCPYCQLKVESRKLKARLLMDGSQAAGLGAILSGLKFLSAYPMSPSTGIMEFIASQQVELGIIVEQAEDEIAAINMALGASYAGVRSMTATSGGGFALMTEGLSLAGMTETPLVIFLAQRPGPATGFPTRTEQGDLMFSLYGGHGEFPRAILAPGDAEETLHCMNQAFNLADRYQIPVIILGDQNLNDSFWTVDDIDPASLSIDRGKLMDSWDGSKGEYKRYQLAPDGISPRLIPGSPGAVGYWDSDEHGEEGHIAESASVRRQMTAKRMKKFHGLQDESLAPVMCGTGDQVLLIGFGTTKWPVMEAVEALARKGEKISGLHIKQPYPLSSEIRAISKGFSKIVVVEQNATGQLEKLLLTELGIKAWGSIRKFDGRPMTAKFVADSYKSL
ncbi:MAG: 2-oxoacid:acceptor oxidoreductase subunit alpha [Candidatus Edwardsbacteria bacterium]|nr:2-oxoacid:acceptor oxidoreductase subunit alpha [Candidatus Edwardsbacteria bacterium]